MYWMILLSASVGAAIFFAGYYVGNNSRHKEEKSSKTPGRKRKPRVPKCAVIALSREGNEELNKKTRKKQSTSERGASNLDNIPGVDINI